MSYLTDAVTNIDTGEASLLHVKNTEHVDLRTCLDAEKYAERLYRKNNKYSGPIHTISETVHDGYRVIVMQENL